MSGLLGKLSPARRIDGNNDLPLFYVTQTSMDPQRRPRDTPRVSVTFTELLMNVEDARNDQSTTRQALEMASPITSSASSFDTWTSAPASSISSSPFVLSFNDLAYNVKIQKKFDPLACCRKSRNGSSVITKILLNGISGEAHEGEMMAVLGACGSSKSTPIDALANRIAKDSLRGSICWM